MAVSTTKIKYSYKIGGIAGAGAYVPITSGDQKAAALTCSALEFIMEIIESTGLGDSKRQRIAQGLEDVSDVTMGFHANMEDAAKLARVLMAARAAGTVLGIKAEYTADQSVEIDWLVGKVGLPTESAGVVMISASLMSKGNWGLTGF